MFLEERKGGEAQQESGFVHIDMRNFTTWVAAQDPKQGFSYIEPSDCAVARYRKYQGFTELYEYCFTAHQLPSPLRNILGKQGTWTFGQLLDRLHAAGY